MSSLRLYLAPAGGGKTAYLVTQARARSVRLDDAPRVILPSQLQVRAWRKRLAQGGGALGVQVTTFDALYRDILAAANQVYTQLTDPVEYRLFSLLITQADLQFYAPLVALPGFVQVVRNMVRELKAGGVFPEELAAAIAKMGGEPRLSELAALYDAYQRRLQEERWADAPGIGWLAAEVLEKHSNLLSGWPCLMVDGFDDLTTVQVRVLRGLASQVGELIITLTGALEGEPRNMVHRRFARTAERLQRELGIEAQPLPAGPAYRHCTAQYRRCTAQYRRCIATSVPALAHLEAALFCREVTPCAPRGAVTMIAAPDREGEVRSALRWLKARLLGDGQDEALRVRPMRPGEVALLARNMEAYRPFVEQVAAEFGLPIHVIGGFPLGGNPAVAALLELLPLALPGEQALAWRPTVAAWRSPYFCWEECRLPESGKALGITAADAEALDCVARWGSVVGGLAQWEEAFASLAQAGERQDRDEDGPPVPDNLPIGEAAVELGHKFGRFVRRIAPPPGVQPCRAFVAWLEGLIGAEPSAPAQPDALVTTDLGMVRSIRRGPDRLFERDWAALNAFKDVLRGLVWAEEALACPARTFAEFTTDLVGAVRAAVYRLPLPPSEEAILVADVTRARGVSFRAAAVLGLAEGEFPAMVAEDPFLRDRDRQQLQSQFGLALDLSAEGAEAEYFYEAVTRARERLLLTRPRIADNGALWPASPFWEEVQRCVAVNAVELTGSSYPPPQEAASWPELLLGASACTGDEAIWPWLAGLDAERCARLERGMVVVQRRLHAESMASIRLGRTRSASPLPVPVEAYDGDLRGWDAFARRFGPHHIWSASRLERYRACPFSFFLDMLGLEPRADPGEGLDGRQLGNIYHHILERLYQSAPDPTDLERLEEALEPVAGEILDRAPQQEQFRATAWWAATRDDVMRHLRETVVALHELSGEFRPHAYERAFGITTPPLVIKQDGDALRLRGFIDRVDVAADGRVRIIDYKTGGPWGYTAKAVQEGKKLQLVLYALAAEQALGLGPIADGFYWHVQHADWHRKNEHSRTWFTLAKLGPEQTIQQALTYAWEAVRGAREGMFTPLPPDDGCGEYCPAVGFCWQYRPRSW